MFQNLPVYFLYYPLNIVYIRFCCPKYLKTVKKIYDSPVLRVEDTVYANSLLLPWQFKGFFE